MAIQSDQEFAPNQIARAVFPTAFRGYDQDAVRRYLSRLAAALEHQQEYAGLGQLEARTPAHERVEELEAELETLQEEIKDLELELVQRSVDGGSEPSDTESGDRSGETRGSVAFDEHRAIELLGQETARVLESARSAAADILKRAETQAASLKAQAKSELAEARRRTESLVSKKQAESEEQAMRLGEEAQTHADQLKGEAEEHRSAVLEESAKILAEAEQLAEVGQAQSEERAKQIVADAETLRQQVISELVSERRQAQVEMDRMTGARDRLAMSLAVARSELDEVADALVDVSTISLGSGDNIERGEAAIDAGLPHAVEVHDLISALEPAAQDESTSDRNGAGDDKAGLDGDDAEEEAPENDASAEAGGPRSKKKRDKRRQPGTGQSGGLPAAKSAGGAGRSDSKAISESKPGRQKTPDKGAGAKAGTGPIGAGAGSSASGKAGPESRPVKTGSALFEDALPGTTSAPGKGSAPARSARAEAVEPATPTLPLEDMTAGDDATAISDDRPTVDLATEGPVEDADEASQAETELEAGDEIEADADSDSTLGSGAGPDSDSDSATDSDADLDDGDHEDDDVEVIDISLFERTEDLSDMNEPPSDGQELSLVEGFTTIELNDPDPAGSDRAGSESAFEDGSDGGTAGRDGDRELVSASQVGEHQTGERQVEARQEPEEMITTVSSRTTGDQRDRTRGDLLIEEPYTGRLAKEFAARDATLTRSGPNFRRQLRRALNDDQSDVLDRLRAGRGEINVDELPAFGDQIDRYLAPLRRGLAEIARAGAKAGGRGDLSQTALDNLVRQLAKYIVDKVRVPTIEVVQHTVDHDRELILEPIRTLYRDFRNVGLSDLTEDALYEAFAIGLYDSIEPSAPISWIIDPRSDPDPVCEINSQRDDVVKGVVFPSGHARPLSLPGCRCLVMKSVMAAPY